MSEESIILTVYGQEQKNLNKNFDEVKGWDIEINRRSLKQTGKREKNIGNRKATISQCQGSGEDCVHLALHRLHQSLDKSTLVIDLGTQTPTVLLSQPVQTFGKTGHGFGPQSSHL